MGCVLPFWNTIRASLRPWSDRDELTRDFPVQIGDKRKRVRERLGDPQEAYQAMEVFYSEGITVYYDIHNDQVDGLLAQRLKSGVAFSGTVHGVSLGDDFSTLQTELGNPVDWGLPYESMSLATWKTDNDRLVIAYIERPNKATSNHSTAGVIRSIGTCTIKSFLSYIAVVSISIEQIRAGKIPTRIEDSTILEASIGSGSDEMKLVNVDFDAPFFAKEYNIVKAELGLMGGAWVYAVFGTDRYIAFWLYPLRWEFPVIRAIQDRTNILSPPTDN